jgi:uncharacterized protein YdaU (DUF1376 family)
VYYTTEAPLPADVRACCRLVLATTEAQREAVRLVLEEFFDLGEAGWSNKRADAEIVEMRRRQQLQRDRAAKRWAAMPRAEHTYAPAMPRHINGHAAASENDASAMPPTPTPTPTPTPKEKDIRTPRSAASLCVSDLVKLGVSEQAAADWMRSRAAKRLPLTQTALDGVRREAEKAGLDLPAAIARAAEEGWAGFKAAWLANAGAANGAAAVVVRINRQQAIEDHNARIAAEWAAEKAAARAAGKVDQ